MRNTKIIMLTSCKGGVGKSTIASNLAMSMAALGKRILIIDCDFGNKCLDILFNMSNEAIYDIGDVIERRINYMDALICHSEQKNLFFLPAPNSFDLYYSIEEFKNVIFKYRDSDEFDYILIDTQGSVGAPLTLCASVSDLAYIVITPSQTAIRAAERTADFLTKKGVKVLRMIVNKLYGKKISDAKEEIANLVSITSIKLIGVIPYEPEFIFAGDMGIDTNRMRSKNAKNAINNIAKRTMGISTPLFDNIRKLKEVK